MSHDFKPLQDKLDKAYEYLRQELTRLRTGKASVEMLDPVRVEAYGSVLKIQELASVSAPEPTQLLIQPWDKGVLLNIEKAINAAKLNLNPVVDGQLIRINVPPLTQERRQEMVKLLNARVEEGRKMIRTIRMDEKKEIEGLEAKGGISEDEIENLVEQMEDTIKAVMAKIDEMAELKQAELMKV